MLDSLNPYRWLIAGAVALVLLGAAYVKGRGDANDAWAVKMAKAAEEARATEQRMQGEADALRDKNSAEKAALTAQLADALVSLRNRPKRMPEAARAACKGGTGAELSAEDAGFLTWEAYRADRILSDLKACQDWAEVVIGQTK